MIAEDNDIVWTRRIRKLKESKFHIYIYIYISPHISLLPKNTEIHETTIKRPMTKLLNRQEKSENAVVKKQNEVRWLAIDTIEDFREAYDTQQVGVVAKIRNASETVLSSHSPETVAFTKLLEIYPQFDYEEFKTDMIEYQIPISVSAFLRGDKPYIDSAFGGMYRYDVYIYLFINVYYSIYKNIQVQRKNQFMLYYKIEKRKMNSMTILY